MSNEVKQDAPVNADEQLHYEEPPRLGLKDGIGVGVALLALAVIGVVGFVQLTPDMEFADLLPRSAVASDAAETTDMQANVQHGDMEMAGDKAEKKHDRCEYCGMYADKSRTHIHATWSDKSETHHDSFDCFFNHGFDEELKLVSAEVTHHESDLDDPQWLDVSQAVYLYDTKRIEGSMPVYVAAGHCYGCTASMEPELGGTEMEWEELTTKWAEQSEAILVGYQPPSDEE